MFVASLGSGSAGNCTYFESDGTRILIDAGFGTRETDRRLQAVGRRLADIQAIVITHEHYDHVRGAERIAIKHGIPIHFTAGTLRATGIDPRAIPTVVFENNTSFRIGNLELHAQRTSHDACDPACFVVEAGDGTRVGIASDLGVVDRPVLDHLKDCNALLFEANHDLDMLRTGSYPWPLKRRIMSRLGHLSNDDSMVALRTLIGEATATLCLIHLSQRNNHESIVRSMATALLEGIGAPIELRVARQSEPVGMISAGKSAPPAPPPAPAGQIPLF
ncbi:MAG: MBL fold metallo-hydrolase [Thermoanaerobaculia bacterium]